MHSTIFTVGNSAISLAAGSPGRTPHSNSYSPSSRVCDRMASRKAESTPCTGFRILIPAWRLAPGPWPLVEREARYGCEKLIAPATPRQGSRQSQRQQPYAAGDQRRADPAAQVHVFFQNDPRQDGFENQLPADTGTAKLKSAISSSGMKAKKETAMHNMARIRFLCASAASSRRRPRGRNREFRHDASSRNFARDRRNRRSDDNSRAESRPSRLVPGVGSSKAHQNDSGHDKQRAGPAPALLVHSAKDAPPQR